MEDSAETQLSKRKSKKLAKRQAKKQKKHEEDENAGKEKPKPTVKKSKIETSKVIAIYDDEGNVIEEFINSEEEVEEVEEVEEQNETESIEQDQVKETRAEQEDKNEENEQEKTVESLEPQDSDNTNESPKSASAHKHKANPEKVKELRQKIASKIQESREKRKAPGTVINGAVRTRDAMLNARREKERVAKEKAQLKRKRTDDDDGQGDDDSDDDGSDDDVDSSNLMYSSVQFADGTKATADLKDLRHQKSKKGPRDILGQLKHVEARQAKMAKLDTEKRSEVEQKNNWSRAIAQAEGAKVRDDVKKLKASLKRHTSKKLKSEKEWNERKEKVNTDKSSRIQKRNENIALKIERNKLHGKKAKKRAGFEGGIAKTRARKLKQASSNTKGKKK